MYWDPRLDIMLDANAAVAYQVAEPSGNRGFVEQCNFGKRALAVVARRSAACNLDAFEDFVVACRRGSAEEGGVEG